MTPLELGVSTNIGQNFAVTVQFEDLAFFFLLLFSYVRIFVKFYWIGKICIIYECWEKNLKHFVAKKILSEFEGFKRGPFEHTKIFSTKYFHCFNIHEKFIFSTNTRFFHKNTHIIKKTNLWPQDLQTAALRQSFAQCWWKRPFLEASLIQNLNKL